MKYNCQVSKQPTRRSKCYRRDGHESCGVNDRKATPKRNVEYHMQNPLARRHNLAPALVTGESRF